ncbi:MAG: DUF4868 domain-containing protein [Lachnospiraceae bacterium]|nr:DUF4868 domain-containing protein [Lachnospiraceae bacterium]
MQIREIKNEIEEMLSENNGIMLYAVLKNEEGKTIKFLNIADENDDNNNTSSSLLKGFAEIIRNKFAVYNEDDEIIKLSSADERKNALYSYDLDELPLEMEWLKGVSSALAVRETFNFREDSLNQIIALIVVVGNENNNLIMYKQQYPISFLNRDRYMLTPILHENRLKRVDQDILRIDFNYQFFLWNDIVYISDIEKMEKICSFHDIILNEAKISIQKIEEVQILDNVEVLSDELDNISFARKLTRIYKDSKVLGKVSNQAIIEFSMRHHYFKNNPLKLTESKDKFILDTKKSKETFIKLMNDDLLTSQLTNSDYESLAKNNL